MEVKKIILMFLTTLCLCFTSFDLISCRSSEYDDYTKGLVFDYCHQFDSTTYKVIAYHGNDVNVKIPATYKSKKVISIDEDAFARAPIESVIISDGVKHIGEYSFYECSSLTNIVIPDSVEYIGTRAFEYCSSLTSITIPNNVKTIHYETFYDCKSLQSVVIGNSVTNIEEHAFTGCYKLTSITIPGSLANICAYGFGGLYLSSTNIYYAGTEEQWNNINIHKTGNEILKKATIHYNYKG